MPAGSLPRNGHSHRAGSEVWPAEGTGPPRRAPGSGAPVLWLGLGRGPCTQNLPGKLRGPPAVLSTTTGSNCPKATGPILQRADGRGPEEVAPRDASPLGVGHEVAGP